MAYSTIRSGSKGSDVKTWQEYLKSQGYDVGSSGADGIFGNATLNATKQYQKDKGLSADGIVGNNTWASMNTGNNTNSANASNTSTISGVSQELMDKAYNNTYAPDDAIKEAEGKKNDALSNYESYVGNTNIVDQSVYDKLGSELVIPEEVTKADAWIAAQLEKIQSGKTSYTDRINSLMDEIMNRDKFEYDVDNDQLFQQALASAMNSGKTAMQDTIGQASALTGGYGSTYATTAGNQAYNQFIEDAYNNLPEYYQMAMEAYQMEGQEMYNQLNMLNTADANEWNKLVTGYDATYQHRNQLYNEAYTAHRDEKTDALNMANLQLTEHEVVSNDLYNLYNAYATDYEGLYAKGYQTWADSVSMAQQQASLLNSDYWTQANYDQTEKWNQKNLDYNYSQLALEREKFNYSKGDTNNDGVVDGNDIQQSSDYKLTDTEITNIRKIYEENGGGEKGELAVLDYLEQKGKYPSADEMAIVESVYKDMANSGGKTSVKTAAISTGEKGNNFLTKEGDNFDIILNDKEYRVENKGKVTDEKLVKKLNNTGASNKSAFVYDGDIYVKYADAYYKVGATNFLLWETSGYQDILKQLQN